MNADQFVALAQLLRLREGPAREATRLVLVEGLRQVDAAAIVGISPAALGNAVARARKGLELAQAVINFPDGNLKKRPELQN